MNRPYQPTPRPLRSMFAVFAATATFTVIGLVHGLAEHYRADATLATTGAALVSRA